MKRLLFALVVSAALFSCNSQNYKGKFKVSGELKGAKDGQKLVLEELHISDKAPEVLDTAEVKNGKFSVSATAPEQGIYRLRTIEGTAAFMFANDGKDMTFTGNLEKAETAADYTFSGVTNASLRKLMMHADSIQKLINRLDSEGAELQKNGAAENDSTLMALSADMKKLTDDFAVYAFAYADTAKSPVVAILATTMAPVELTKFEKPLVGLAKRFPEHKGIGEALSFVKKQMAGPGQPEAKAGPATVGNPAPELTMNDVNGKPFSLSQLRGKYVLVDFWASWCAPCREENPNVVAAYNQFKDKNFTVLGVSLDRDKDAWAKAIKADNLNWNHISDLKFWNSEAVGLYGFDGIPYNVLVDPQGKIIANNLRGPELVSKLKEFIK